jgi:hypothetical protein
MTVIHTWKMVTPIVSVFTGGVIKIIHLNIKIIHLNVFLISSLVNLSCPFTPNIDFKNIILIVWILFLSFFCQYPVFAAIVGSRGGHYFIKHNLCSHSGFIF